MQRFKVNKCMPRTYIFTFFLYVLKLTVVHVSQWEVLAWYLVLLGVLTQLMVSEYLILDGMLYTQWKTLKFWMILETVMSILFILTVPCQYVFPCLLLFHISTNYFFDLHEVPWSKFLYFSCSQMITKSGFHLLAIMVIIS